MVRASKGRNKTERFKALGGASSVQKSLTTKFDENWKILASSGKTAVAAGNFEAAEVSWQLALLLAERFNDGSSRLACALENLADVLWRQRKYAEAEPYCRTALDIFVRELGADHIDVGVLTNNLAVLCHAQGKLTDAEPLYKRALAIKSVNNRGVDSVLRHYAKLLHSMNRGAEAERLCAFYTQPLKSQRTTSNKHQTQKQGPLIDRLINAVEGSEEREWPLNDL
jgi:tetratricopeptide (TPR) repeat protein